MSKLYREHCEEQEQIFHELLEALELAAVQAERAAATLALSDDIDRAIDRLQEIADDARKAIAKAEGKL